MNKLKKIVVAVAVFVALGFSALVATGNVPPAYASFPPPGGVDAATPTPN